MAGSLSNPFDWDKRVLRVRSLLVLIDFYLASRYHKFCRIPSNWTNVTLCS